MDIAERLRQLREAKNLSQGDIEKRAGLLRCYLSRVENGHTVPAIETLEKIARALEVPMYQLFYDHQEMPTANHSHNGKSDWASNRKGQRLFLKLRDALATRRFHSRWKPRLKTSHKRSYRVAMRPNTSSCCHAKWAALSNVAWASGLTAVTPGRHRWAT